MKTKIRKISFNENNLKLLGDIDKILLEYSEKRIKVTLRQLYYQLVARDILPNQTKEYSKLSTLLTKARYAGKVDWEAIEDRVRIPKIPLIFENTSDLVEQAIGWYELNRWKGQNTYVEIWTEKDALSSVIAPITYKFQVVLMINRGYTSASAIYDAAKRFHEKRNLEKIILYLGDHDPSGLDMIRDIEERLTEFGLDINVKSIALTMNQIKEYSPPPNPTKITDPRAKKYIEEFGAISWEVDALKPDILEDLIKTNILGYLDITKFNKVRKQERKDIEILLKKLD